MTCRVDMTLASGWPYGGPHVPVDQAAGQLRVVDDGCCCWNRIGREPAMDNGESLIAVFAGAGTAKTMTPTSAAHHGRAITGRSTLKAESDHALLSFFMRQPDWATS